MNDRSRNEWRERSPLTRDPAGIKAWLTDSGSLTGRLQALGFFSVVLQNQRLAKPTDDEAAELGLGRTQLAWIREVALFLDGRPVVFAHTVLPRHPRGPMTQWLERLGNRSLGALLFAHPRFSRGPLAARRLDRRHALFQRSINALQLADVPPPALWARRSRFSFGEQSILVTEVFSPAVAKFRSTRGD